MENWFKITRYKPFIKFEVKGYEKLSAEFRKIISGYSLKEELGEVSEIHLHDYTRNDMEIVEMFAKELLANDFQEINESDSRI